MLSKMMKDPAMKQMLRQQQTAMVDMMYGPMFKELGLSAEDADKLKELLLDRQMNSLAASRMWVRQYARGPRPTHPEIPSDSMPPPSPGAQKLLTRIVLGDILDDGILAARPSDPAFPLRLFFGELSRLLAAARPGIQTPSRARCSGASLPRWKKSPPPSAHAASARR